MKRRSTNKVGLDRPPPPRQPPGPPIAIPAQPFPIDTRTSHMRIGGQEATAVWRRFAGGESRRCRLCDRCDAVDDSCLKLFNFHVPTHKAPLFNSRGIPVEPAGPTLFR